MSTNFVEIVNVDYVKPHPNADKLEIAIVRNATIVIGKDYLKKDDKAVYFPPDMLVRTDVADKLSVSKYLKHSIYPGDIHKTACRVAACRLRTQASYGFLSTVPPELSSLPVGTNVDEHFAAFKYEPPMRVYHADQAAEHPLFHRYTSLEHYWRFGSALVEGTPVRITEKIHGTNSRVGVIKVDDEWQFVAGSHKTQRKRADEDKPTPLYWKPLEKEGMLSLLNNFCDEKHNVIVFGEIYGSGIQDMDYGTNVEFGYRVFDISVDGRYLDWSDVKHWCDLFGIETVPLLYTGPFSHDLVEKFTHGPTTVATPDAIKSPFKGREGCVITPLQEQFSAILGGRLALKSVSADYLDRKDGLDNGDLA